MVKEKKLPEPHPFDYTNVPLPEDCFFKISPSSISKFFDFPVIWYKEQILGDRQFTGSTATVLGSIIHGLAEFYAKGLPTDRDLVEKYLRQHMMNPEVNCKEIRDLYPDMAKLLINDYIKHNKPTEVEVSIVTQIEPGIYLGGTCDNLTGTTVVDYKNVSQKPAGDTIPWGYYIQMMAYAYLYRKEKKVNVDRIRLVYTIRPTKTIGPRLHIVNRTIDETDYKAFEDVLTIMCDTVKLSRLKPEFNHILFKSMQLKDK
jgi:hypothetical protein